MTVTHFRRHVVECPNCGHKSTAETKLVAQQGDLIHARACNERIRQEAIAAEVKDRQGSLF